MATRGPVRGRAAGRLIRRCRASACGHQLCHGNFWKGAGPMVRAKARRQRLPQPLWLLRSNQQGDPPLGKRSGRCVARWHHVDWRYACWPVFGRQSEQSFSHVRPVAPGRVPSRMLRQQGRKTGFLVYGCPGCRTANKTVHGRMRNPHPAMYPFRPDAAPSCQAGVPRPGSASAYPSRSDPRRWWRASDPLAPARGLWGVP